MFKVTTPVTEFSGEVAGVGFVKGEAVTDDGRALAYFRSAGYKLELVDAMPDQAGEPEQEMPSRPAGNASRDAWMTYAAALGMDDNDTRGMTRDALIEACDDLEQESASS